MATNYNNFIVFDFETGGLKPREHAAVEIACLIVDGKTLEFKDSYSSIIKPFSDKLTYTDGAMKVHGITVDMMHKEGKSVQEVVSDLEAFFTKATYFKGPKNKPILVGQNVLFDIPFLFQIFLFCKRDLSKYLQTSKDIYDTVSPSYVDTLNDSKRFFNSKDEDMSLSLGTVCSYFGIELNDAHRAMNDVVATAELFRLYTQRLRTIGSGSDSSLTSSKFRNKFQLKFPEEK